MTNLFGQIAWFIAAFFCLVMSLSAQEDRPIIIISYGGNLDSVDTDSWTNVIRENGIEISVNFDLDDPECVSILVDGHETFRFTEETMNNATLATVATRLAQGKRIPRSVQSDCPSSRVPTNP